MINLRSQEANRSIIQLHYHCQHWLTFQEDIAEIFKAADRDHSGTLTIEEFHDMIDDIVIRYPQVELYLKSKHLAHVNDLLKWKDVLRIQRALVSSEVEGVMNFALSGRQRLSLNQHPIA